jgi:UDP-GlcNAc:undecaprenyl-phosphate GlcNAc-1-phosphate transferase
MDLQFVPILAVGFATSLGLTPLSRQVALRLGVIDKPKTRNITKAPTPMMGGLAIYISFVLALILFSPTKYFVELGAIIFGSAFLAFVGLLDDRFDLGIRVKLVAMTLAACGLIAVGIHIQFFKTPFLDYPITIIWVLAITNAVNFLDNMDGLTAGLTAIAAGFFLLIGIVEHLSLVSGLSAALCGSAVGFLIYNFNPASAFMGEMGALMLGFTLSALGIILKFGSQPPNVSWMIPVLVLALPIFDINLVVFTRLMEGRSPGEAGKDHTSHRIMSLGLSQRSTLITLYTACIFFGTIGLAMGQMSTDDAWRIGIISIAVLGILFIAMMIIRRKYQVVPEKKTVTQPAE